MSNFRTVSLKYSEIQPFKNGTLHQAVTYTLLIKYSTAHATHLTHFTHCLQGTKHKKRFAFFFASFFFSQCIHKSNNAAVAAGLLYGTNALRAGEVNSASVHGFCSFCYSASCCWPNSSRIAWFVCLGLFVIGYACLT